MRLYWGFAPEPGKALQWSYAPTHQEPFGKKVLGTPKTSMKGGKYLPPTECRKSLSENREEGE
ncbi:MAG: hypothetical protein ACI3YH_01770, partial [Eubacteriales bacterium]